MELIVDRIGKDFIGLKALDDVSFSLNEGQIVALIGPNGAGKTTLINLITGDLAPTTGSIRFGSQEIARQPAFVVKRAGITRTYQAVELFRGMTVLENVMTGGVDGARLGMLQCLFPLPSVRRGASRLRERALDALEIVGLQARADESAATLSAGWQRLLAIARAIATGNRWLILDEPGAGLNQLEKEELTRVIRRLAGAGKTILFVEHDMSLVGNLAERVIVLDGGRLIADGSPAEVRRTPQVVDAYLGVSRVVRAGVSGPSTVTDRVATVSLDKVTVRYGASTALSEISLMVPAGGITAIVGPNGAGKSTLLKTIIRSVPHAAGTMRIQGLDAWRMRPREVVQSGIALAPEGRELFTSLTVLENLELGAYTRRSPLLGRARDAGGLRALERIFALFPRLAERRNQLAGTLSGGEGQMLAIGRALMSEPVLLMLDEPSLGIAPQLVSEIFRRLVDLRREGLTILLVEQNARAALEIADRGYVLESGRIIAEGEARALLESPEIAAAYLGGEDARNLATERPQEALR
ncbi:MAG: ATP-binding cassette domain-containing protein [Burkholderiales bacterium]